MIPLNGSLSPQLFMKIDLDRVLDILERPAYVEVLLSIAIGRNYATSIARYLKKKQPTITEQLAQLESLGLIKPISRRKSKEYEVEWDLLLMVFYDVIREASRRIPLTREEKKVFKKDLEKIIPPELVKVFLQEYFETFSEFGGKKKGFDEIIFSFFSALYNLDKPYWRKLENRFNIDGKNLAVLANFMQFWVNGIEQTALMSHLDSQSKKAR